MATYAQLKTNVSRKLGLDTTAGSDEQTMVGGHLNEAVVEVLLETHCRVTSGTAALTSGSGDYELDANILAITKVIDSQGCPLERVSEATIEEFRRGSATASYPSRYAVTGSNLLMVYPSPNSATVLTVYYVPRPTPMSADSHDPSSTTYGGIPSEFHKALEFYALWQGADYDDDSTSQNGDRYRGQYESWLGKIKRNHKFKGGSSQPRVRLGRKRSMLSSDPSRT